MEVVHVLAWLPERREQGQTWTDDDSMQETTSLTQSIGVKKVGETAMCPQVTDAA
jgi:hypothetical protein